MRKAANLSSSTYRAVARSVTAYGKFHHLETCPSLGLLCCQVFAAIERVTLSERRYKLHRIATHPLDNAIREAT